MIVLAGTAALTLIDEPVARTLQRPSMQGRRTLRTTANTAKFVNERSLFATSIITYGVGQLAHGEHMAEFGLHASEAILLAATVSTLIKSPLGRSRPFVTNDTNPYDFNFMRGFKEPQYRSLPSLHEGGSYAFATVLAHKLRQWSPGTANWAGPALYIAALLPGLGRMYTNKHWSSDILIGSAIGIASGKAVDRLESHHPDNRADRILLGITVSPGERGHHIGVLIR